jgi:hypothetical protein
VLQRVSFVEDELQRARTDLREQLAKLADAAATKEAALARADAADNELQRMACMLETAEQRRSETGAMLSTLSNVVQTDTESKQHTEQALVVTQGTVMERERAAAALAADLARAQSERLHAERHREENRTRLADAERHNAKSTDELTALYQRCGALERRLASEEKHKNKALTQCKHLTEQLQASAAALQVESRHAAEVAEKERRAQQATRLARNLTGEVEAKASALEVSLARAQGELSARDDVR